MIEAAYYSKKKDSVKCVLCPHNCELKRNESGICKVRSNIDGKLYSTNYDILTAVNIDPIEKKPLFHFYPGKKVLSIGSNGCNLKCKCCQNWEIAHVSSKNYVNDKKMGGDELLEVAINRNGNIGLAYTYNEPVVWIEYMLTVAKKIKEAGLKNIMVSNGYINKKPLLDLIHVIDAFNIDIKSFSNQKYRDLAKGEIKPVKETIKIIVKSEKHVELTNLIVPGISDDINEFKEMINWIAGETGNETVLHLSRYFPAYKMTESATSTQLLEEMYQLAREKLKYVYLGNINIESSQDSFCSKCGKRVIKRRGYVTEVVALDENGNCEICSNKIIINN